VILPGGLPETARRRSASQCRSLAELAGPPRPDCDLCRVRAACCCSAKQAGGRQRRGPTPWRGCCRSQAGAAPAAGLSPGQFPLADGLLVRQGESLCGTEFHRWGLQPAGLRRLGRTSALAASKAGAGRNGRRAGARPKLHFASWTAHLQLERCAQILPSPGAAAAAAPAAWAPAHAATLKAARRFVFHQSTLDGTSHPTPHVRAVGCYRTAPPPGPARGATPHTDLALLPDGEDEARALASVLSPLSFPQRCSCSPLLRARQTLAELAGLAGAALPCGICAVDYGDYEGITTAEIAPAGSRVGVPGSMVAQAARVWAQWISAASG